MIRERVVILCPECKAPLQKHRMLNKNLKRVVICPKCHEHFRISKDTKAYKVKYDTTTGDYFL